VWLRLHPRTQRPSVFVLAVIFICSGAACRRIALDRFLESRAREPIEARSVVLEETALSRKSTLELAKGDGRRFVCFVREPRTADGPFPAVLILAGFETGRESLDFIEERGDVVFMSMNYPYPGKPPQGVSLLWSLGRIRRMAFDTLEGAALALAYLARRPDVDPRRILVLGVSFGSIFATAVGAHDPHPSAVVLIYGGGGLPSLAHRNLRRWGLPMPRFLVRPVTRWFFSEMEPLEHVARIAPRYLLMINSERDEMFPPAAGRALFERANEPKKLVWYETGHMDLFDPELVRRITRQVISELEAAGQLPVSAPETHRRR
jgi:hypothetical protein